MKTWEIVKRVPDRRYYTFVEAETEEEALEIAMGHREDAASIQWFPGRSPHITPVKYAAVPVVTLSQE